MNPSILLRVASVITLLFAAGHTMGAWESWSPAGETEVLGAMRTFRFDAEGVNRTYLDFYLGFGFVISVYLLLQAILLWQLAAITKLEPLNVRPLIGSFFVASVVSALVSWRFIFTVPVACFAVIAVCLGLAFHAAGKSSNAQQSNPADT